MARPRLLPLLSAHRIWQETVWPRDLGWSLFVSSILTFHRRPHHENPRRADVSRTHRGCLSPHISDIYTDVEAHATRTRWRETQSHSANLAELRRAVRYNGPSSPCVSGCRSVCWKVSSRTNLSAEITTLTWPSKTFLWFKDGAATNWQQLLSEARKDYSKRQEVFLKFIKHPEDLAKLAVDPLADDPDVSRTRKRLSAYH